MNPDSCLRKTKGRIHHSSWHIPHSSELNLNLHADCNPEVGLTDNLDSLCEKHENYPFTASLPIPMGSPTLIDRSVLNGIDPAFNLVSEKFAYEFRCEAFKRKVKSLPTKKMKKRLSKMSSDFPFVKIHPNVASLAQIISEDPDPNFRGEYNYYYGGTLAMAENQGRCVLVYPELESPGTLTVVTPKFEDELCVRDRVHRIDHNMGEVSPIYQVQSCEELLLMRQKSRCGLFRLDCNGDIFSLAELKSVSTVESFYTSSMNKYRKGEFVTLSPPLKLEIFDSSNDSTPKMTLKLDFIENSDKWGSVHYHDANNVMFCDRNSIYIFDSRRPASRSALSWDIVSCTETCDQIYSSVKGSSLHYVCSSHNLLALDIRRGWVQRWSHGLAHTPTLLSALPDETSNDSLLIASQTGGEVVNVHNAHSEGFDFSLLKTPPYRLPTLKETLHYTSLSGNCLSPLIKPRFFQSLTGLAYLRTGFNVDIFLCSSVGDVFTQRMCFSQISDTPFISTLRDSEINRLKEWQRECLDQLSNMKTKLGVTAVLPCQGLRTIFEDCSNSASIDESESPEQKPRDTIQPWMWSRKQLKKCCDVLAPELLSVWKCDDGPSSEVEAELDAKSDLDDADESDSSDEIDVTQQVQDWLMGSVAADVSDQLGPLD